MIKKLCYNCGADWEVFGKEWKRTGSNKIDYRCSKCKSKRKPNEYEFTQPVTVDPDPKPIDISRRMIGGPENLLVIGDIHEPFCLEGYKEFCQEIYEKYNCDQVIFMGDIIDQHYSSFHATDPDGWGGGDELDFAIEKLHGWKQLFPDADVVMGNHDKIILRKAFANGISKRWIRDFKDVLKVNWNFQPSHTINGILFRHGVGQKAAPKAGTEFMSVVQGHFHTESYIHWRVGQGKIVFGAQCPCGIDRKAYAAAYAEEFAKPAIGCMVIREFGRLPIIEMMEI